MIPDRPDEIEKDIFEDLYNSNLKVFEDFAFFILGNTEQAEDVVLTALSGYGMRGQECQGKRP